MGLIFPSLGWDLAFIAASLAVFTAWVYTKAFSYWSSRGVYSIKPVIFFGNMKDKILMVRSFSDVLNDIYRNTEGHKFVGLYDAKKPMLMVKDLELIKNIMARDFTSFSDRGIPSDKSNPISENLFNIGGSRWRKLRNKLTPTFTSGKMKLMYKLMLECSEELVAWLKDLNNNEEVVEVKEMVAKFTTDVIGSCVFGLQINALKDPNSEFRMMGRSIVDPPQISRYLIIMATILPFFRKFLQPKNDDKNAFFLKIVKEVVSFRENTNVVRDDFIQMLIQLKKYGKVDTEKNPVTESTTTNRMNEQPNFDTKRDDSLEITDGLLAAQCYIFFVAGFETSSTTISCCLHELSVNTAVQDRLRREVATVLRRHDHQLNYEALQEMKYLDQVIDETLRKYPPVSFLFRACTKPYTVPGSNVHIDKGTMTIIPVRSLHHDPKYFPCPERFDPERFNEENVKKIPQFAYLPFGEGPRLCIGLRFGRMQVKVCLIALLKHFEFSVCDKTSVPLRFSFKIPFIDTPKEVWLRVKKIPVIQEFSQRTDVYKRVKVQRDMFQNSS
ncbi:probable cytochrome P450 6a13 [Bacillus rossius redtenbacheri]|uniref:probable cytochrome P450 6a13 n=1 Tax=Bacillus rossius redtenbacheri TaxID=93214 RepID=UPI002FDC9DFA